MEKTLLLTSFLTGTRLNWMHSFLLVHRILPNHHQTAYQGAWDYWNLGILRFPQLLTGEIMEKLHLWRTRAAVDLVGLSQQRASTSQQLLLQPMGVYSISQKSMSENAHTHLEEDVTEVTNIRLWIWLTGLVEFHCRNNTLIKVSQIITETGDLIFALNQIKRSSQSKYNR